MTLSKPRLIFYALLLVGAVTGLAIDRAGSPAAPTSENRPAVAAAPIAFEDVIGASVEAPPMAAIFRLTSAHVETSTAASVSPPVGSVRDAFVLAPAMRDHYRSQSQGASKQRQQKKLDRVDGFTKSHRLEGTCVQPGAQWAIVNDRIVRIGDQIGGFQVTGIEDYRALFSNGQETVVLSLPMGVTAQESP